MKQPTLEELKEKLFFAELEVTKARNWLKHCEEVVKKYKRKIIELGEECSEI